VKSMLTYIVQIEECLGRIRDYTQNGREHFMADPKTQDAVIRNFEVVGEAAKRLSPEFVAAHPKVPWRRIAGFRDVLIHAYDRVDLSEIWNIIEQHLPSLIDEIKRIRQEWPDSIRDPEGAG